MPTPQHGQLGVVRVAIEPRCQRACQHRSKSATLRKASAPKRKPATTKVDTAVGSVFVWSGAHEVEGQRATKAWSNAIAGLRKAKTKTERTTALRKFVMAFNTVQKRGLIPIDALRAAEVEAAFGQLVERAKVQAGEGAGLFAEWRRF